MSLLGRDKPGAEQTLARYEAEEKKYEKESKEVKEEAQEKEQETRHTEDQALRYDLGEGMLEIGVVLASLYFHCAKEVVSGDQPGVWSSGRRSLRSRASCYSDWNRR